MKYLLIFIWVELICMFAFGCSGPREKRGDWMEHLNYKQFNHNAPTLHWDRHNYYSEEELRQMWIEAYNKAQANLVSPEEQKRIESLYQRPY